MGPAARSNKNDVAQVVTEAVLVSGVSPYAGTTIDVTLTASRVVGAPVYLSGEKASASDRLSFIVRQSSTGSYTLTWNAVFQAAGVAQTASATAVDTVGFEYDGAKWVADE